MSSVILDGDDLLLEEQVRETAFEVLVFFRLMEESDQYTELLED